ncbi:MULTISPECIES: ABC transporter permease [unclassified Bacillus (in: firmicutes)]|uniref:ABC transporter permease n=1 Tax=unclassified Bacillus (in: firmicutes) TaxID=185979 RepID=UPI0008EADEA4|nr:MULTISPECIES: ABC transporter permease [unclassified Bacillus (in: firmicutes)]SFI69846.1 hypothetical protein SAMN04488574_10431 [Bacillus sp. 71mf]SFS89738.1 hypothetical protein SAMN04488145_104335 [Bacillus sp. 103mf]
MNIKKLVRTDVIKQKRGLLWLIIFIIPLGTTVAMFLDMYLRYEDFLYHSIKKQGVTSWEMLLIENHALLQWGKFLPIFVAVIGVVVYQIEFKQSSWTTLLSLPVTKSSVFISKFITIMIFSALLICLNTIGLIVVGIIIGFPEAVDIGLYSKYVINQCIAILGVAALHNWLSSYLRNMVIPVAIGFIGMILSSIIFSQIPAKAKFFPYLYPYLIAGQKEINPSIALYSGLASGVIILLLGIIEFQRRDIS